MYKEVVGYFWKVVCCYGCSQLCYYGVFNLQCLLVECLIGFKKYEEVIDLINFVF